MKSIPANRQEMTHVVLGTAGLGGIRGDTLPRVSIDTILEALENGIGAIDTAPAYGDAETFVGQALAEWTGERPMVSTKVGRLKSYQVDQPVVDFSRDGLYRSVEESLEQLRLPRLDLLLLHEPQALRPQEADEVIGHLLELRRQGYTDALGVGGNALPWFRPYIKQETFEVVMEYNRLTAICLDGLRDTMPLLEAGHILPYLASPLHMGLLGNRFADFTSDPPPWLETDSLRRAERLRALPGTEAFSLSTLAHRFLLSFTANARLVIGPSGPEELRDTLADIASGPLPGPLFDAIYQLIP